jgi:hypothetical protein
VLDLQYQGDKAASDKFIERSTSWSDGLHGLLGRKVVDAERYRFWLVSYAAVGR